MAAKLHGAVPQRNKQQFLQGIGSSDGKAKKANRPN
jgi:hypothetical protein